MVARGSGLACTLAKSYAVTRQHATQSVSVWACERVGVWACGRVGRGHKRTDGDVLFLELNGGHALLVGKDDHAEGCADGAVKLLLDAGDARTEGNGEGRLDGTRLNGVENDGL